MSFAQERKSLAIILVAAFIALISGCDKSVVGPAIENKPYPTPTADEDDEDDDTEEEPATMTCDRSSGHNIYYAGSSISLSYACESAVTSVAGTSTPSFLSSSISASTVTYSGTAPAAASTTTWSFAANDLTTSGDASDITTEILSASGLSASTTTSTNLVTADHNTERDLAFQSALSSSWDGSMSDVTLTGTSITTDMHGISLSASCTGATAPYLCLSTSSVPAANTIDAALKLKWKWSKFDQGRYYLTVVPRLTIESGQNNLTATDSTFIIPAQTADTILTKQGDPSNSGAYNNQNYSYGIAVNTSSSSSAAPIAGLVYTSLNTSHRSYFTRVLVDRHAGPSVASPSGITQSSTDLELTTANSSSVRVKALSSTTWMSLAVRSNGQDNIYFTRITDSATAPSAAVATELTTFATTNASWVDLTEPFDDGGTQRFGFAYVRTGNYVAVAKGNPAGSDMATVMDDADYESEQGATDPADFEVANASTTDRVKIRYISESGTGYFYVGYRVGATVKFTKLRSSYSGGYGDTTVTLLSGTEFVNSATNKQSFDMALGTSGGSTVIGVVYREQDAANSNNPKCYFRKISTTTTPMDTFGTAVAISTNKCYWPTIHYHSTTGKFIVTYAEANGTNDTGGGIYYDTKTKVTLVTLGATDTLSTTPITLFDYDDGNTATETYPIKLETNLYPTANWVGVFYRTISDDKLRFHGFHVPGRTSANP